MRNIKLLFVAAILVITGFIDAGERSIKERMKADLDTIRNILELQYAPLRWKQNYAGWDLPTELQKAKNKIDTINPITLKDYQAIVRDFLRSAQDYHVVVEFYSTETATLPFRVKGAGGKYFITEIDHEQLSPKAFPWQEGDELVMFDGRPVQEVIEQLIKNELGHGFSSTDIALAETYLTSRDAALGHKVPKGPLIVSVKPQGSSTLSTYQLIWDYTPEKIPSGFNPPYSLSASVDSFESYEDSQTNKLKALFDFRMATPLYKSLSNSLRMHPETTHDLGARQSFIPALGTISWETEEDNKFDAYLCKTPEGISLGYVRINSYDGKEAEVEEFGEIIEYLQKNSDALVIDQINNPGGSVFYMYALASMLTDRPLHTPKHRSSITPHEVAQAVEFIPQLESANTEEKAQDLLGQTFSGTPVTLQMVKFMLNYFRFVVKEWEAGKSLMGPFYLYGIDCINPHPTARYTKPILILINSLDFSGGDFFPAIFQDNKRAKIFGSRTAGAGGHMTSASFPNRFGIKSFSYTRSFAERMDKNPIENLGVRPDIPYELTQEDLQHNYIGYVTAIQQAVKKIVTNKY